MEDGGRWHSGNNRKEFHVSANIEPSIHDHGCDQEDLTTTTKTAPASMAHLEQYTDGDWVEPSDELIGTAVFDATGDQTTMPSWDDLVRQHADRVYRLAYRLSGNQHDAEDLTQETFIRVFRSVQNYQPGTFEGWLHRITTNLFLDWDDLVRQHADRVYRLAYRLSGNQHDAEDLTQETFIRVFRSVQNYQPGTFEGWLHRITTNLFLDAARRKQRIRFEGLADEMAHRLPGSEPTPAQAFDDSHLDDDVQAALKALPPEYRAAVVLCDIEGFSYEEIAATLGVKLGTVRSRIHRGRAQLRSALEHRRPAPAPHRTALGRGGLDRKGLVLRGSHEPSR